MRIFAIFIMIFSSVCFSKNIERRKAVESIVGRNFRLVMTECGYLEPNVELFVKNATQKEWECLENPVIIEKVRLKVKRDEQKFIIKKQAAERVKLMDCAGQGLSEIQRDFCLLLGGKNGI